MVSHLELAIPTNTQIAVVCIARITITRVVALLVNTLAVFRAVRQGDVLAFIDI